MKHTLYHQFLILDSNYASFVDFIRHMQPSQEQLDEFQEDIVLYPSGDVDNKEIFEPFNKSSNTTMMTVSCAAAQRVNESVVDRVFTNNDLLIPAMRLDNKDKTGQTTPTQDIVQVLKNVDENKT